MRVAAHQARAGVAEPLLTTARAMLSSSADMAAECHRACLSAGRGELLLRVLVELTSAAARFSSRCAHEEVPGISRTLGARPSSPGERDLGGGEPSRCGGAETCLLPSTGLARCEAGAQREERHEGDPARGALLEHGHRGAVGQVQRVLHARDRGVLQRVQQVLAGDVAQADAADQALVARLDHGGELVVEPLVRPAPVHQPQVDGGQLVDAEAAQVVLDPAAQLAGSL